MKIINNPLIIIKKVIIEYIKLKDHIDIIIQIKLVYIRRLMVKKIGWIFIIEIIKIINKHKISII